jgi:PAS domain S-box-containing protein
LASDVRPALDSPSILADEQTARLVLQRARRLLWLTLLPLLVGVLLLAAWQAQVQWQRLLDRSAAETRAHRPAFEGLARDANHHVDDLRRWMEQEFLRDGGPTPAIALALQPRRTRGGAADGYTLDGLAEALRPGMAQLLWPQGDGSPPPPELLRRAESLSSVIAIAHLRNSSLGSSWFFGWPERYRLVYPWLPSSTLVEERRADTLSAALAAWHDGAAVQNALPERNPTRQAYWSAAQVDPDGRGLLVTRAAPVLVADSVRGVVGTELRLQALDALLAALPAGPWSAWVVDDQGQVLADRQRPLQATADGTPLPAVPRLAERLPAGIDAALLARAAAGDGPALAVGNQQVLALRLREAPWTLVQAAPRGALLQAMLPQLAPYLLIVAALLALGAGGQALLRQRVVAPLADIFEYLQRLSADADAPEPHLSPRWQPWVRVVTRTFEAMRAAAGRERRAEALKSAIVDHAQAAVVVADAEDRIVEFNAAAEAMLGLPRQQAVGRSARELICPPRFRERYDLARRRMRSGDPDGLLGRRMERQVQRADGSELPVEVVMWLTQVDGADYFTASMTDLSEARASAEVIARQRDALRQSEKLGAMGALLAGVAHELNNPLAIVMGRAGLLEEKTEGTPLHADARRIRDAAERCGRIVRTFLNMARSRPARHAPVQLNDLVRAAADMLGYTLRSHDIELELRLLPELPEVMADGDQIGQVVLNLIVNAQQALAAHDGGPRRITVHSGRVQQRGAAGVAWLRVTDSGPGVPPAVRERVFEPFFTTKAEGAGTGLGLSVSRSIVREHGGELELEPAVEGQGAAFTLRLPLPAQAAAAAPAAAPVMPPPASAVAATAARLLVVDDEPGIVELLRRLLEEAGYEVAAADSGALALALLDSARFDAVVSDLRMPDMDGAALWQALRRRHPALAGRLLFVTGDTLSATARRILDATGCPHLNKPFTREDLLLQVARVLQGAAGESGDAG